jgi:hypothetical protein
VVVILPLVKGEVIWAILWHPRNLGLGALGGARRVELELGVAFDAPALMRPGAEMWAKDAQGRTIALFWR